MKYRDKPNRSGFYIVILSMLLVSVSLFIYTERGLKNNGEETSVADTSGFIAIELSHIPAGAQSLMKAFLPSMSEAAGQYENEPTDPLKSIILNTTDDGKNLPSANEDDMSEEDILLAEKFVAWQEYVVRQGETLSEIVSKFSGISMNDVVRANELGDSRKVVGKQILLIPLGEEFVEDTLDEVRVRKARVVVSKLDTMPSPIQVKNYLVRDGDSLWSIANAMDVEIDTIIGSNSLGAVLRPNTSLRIPNQDGIFYTFKAGDTARSVAGKFRIPLAVLKKVNHDIDLESLTEGAEIFLPEARPEAETPKQQAQKPGQKQTQQTSVAAPSSGPFRWPVAGKITSPFGWRKHPIFRRSHFHPALDIKAPRGTPIRAAKGGTVVYSGWQGGYGRTVVIDHGGGLTTLYGHCAALTVNKGQAVGANTVIATVGSTGVATGSHVHFEARMNNRAVNPLRYLK